LTAKRLGCGSAAVLALGAALAAWPAAGQVQVKPLDQLDLFSIGAQTDLGPGLWKGSSAALARRVIPTIAAKPLTPAGTALARRVLATGANGPEGAGFDADLAGARAMALVALGDASTASLIADHTPAAGQSAALSQAAAEAALIEGGDDKACAVGDSLSSGRGELYWLRLRAYCQAIAKAPAAGLSLQLAEQQGAGAAYRRLMGAVLRLGKPGEAALDDGIDYALSRRLGLDLTPALAKAAPAIAVAVLRSPGGAEVVPAANPAPSVASEAPSSAEAGAAPAPPAEPPPVQPSPLRQAALDRITALGLPLSAGGDVDLLAPWPQPAPGGEGAGAPLALALRAALSPPVIADARADLAGLDLGPSRASQAVLLALDLAADAKAVGDVALLAILIDQDGGPAAADRVRIVRALTKVGLTKDAQAFAAVGLKPAAPRP
jgi:hypothetical protein